MNGLPYYKAYPRDFIEGTVGMDFEMKAAYRLVLDLIYMQNGNLPDDPRYISGLLGCSTKKWNSLRGRLISAGKIHARDGHIGNYRADKELETLGKFQDKQRENRSRPNKNNGLKSPPINHTEPDTEPKKDIPLRGPAAGTSSEAEVYAVGKKVLGKSAGGVITKLRKACGYDDGYTLDWLRQAAEKQSPIEWINAVLKATDFRPYRNAINVAKPRAPMIESKEDREWRRIEAEIYRGAL